MAQMRFIIIMTITDSDSDMINCAVDENISVQKLDSFSILVLKHDFFFAYNVPGNVRHFDE